MQAIAHSARCNTVQVTIARATRADAADLIAAHLDSRTHHYPFVAPFTDQAGFDTWMARQTTGPCIGLVARTPDAVVGIINLNEIVAGAFCSAYLGYWSMAGIAGHGLMTVAMQQAIRFAFEDLGLHRLEANIQPDNARSIALVQRLGFRKEGFSPRYLKIGGVWCDHERWAKLADA